MAFEATVEWLTEKAATQIRETGIVDLVLLAEVDETGVDQRTFLADAHRLAGNPSPTNPLEN